MGKPKNITNKTFEEAAKASVKKSDEPIRKSRGDSFGSDAMTPYLKIFLPP